MATRTAVCGKPASDISCRPDRRGYSRDIAKAHQGNKQPERAHDELNIAMLFNN